MIRRDSLGGNRLQRNLSIKHIDDTFEIFLDSFTDLLGM